MNPIRKTNHLSKALAFLLIFTLTVSILLTACGGNEDESSTTASSVTESVSSSAEISKSESLEDSSEDTAESSESVYEASSEAESSEDVESSIPDESSELETSVDESSEPETSVDESSEPDTSVEPEDDIVGAGTESDPYLVFPSEDMTVETVGIASNSSVFYSIYRVGGMILTVENKNAFVVYGGKKYTPESGKIVIKLENALASDSVPFEIGNSGSKEETLLLAFSNQKGSYANPVTVKNVSEESKISLEAGNEVGYYYKHVTEKSGTIRFYMTATADSVLIVTNNRNSAQRTTESDSATDENGNEYVELEVEKGDELIINVGAKPNKRGKYPAAEITWRGEYK
ncbi:MAG: hypothetical protein IJO64_05120 [Clostridia bacterium]|nr:hypothetical protein [Clostridia bacterium]